MYRAIRYIDGGAIEERELGSSSVRWRCELGAVSFPEKQHRACAVMRFIAGFQKVNVSNPI